MKLKITYTSNDGGNRIETINVSKSKKEIINMIEESFKDAIAKEKTKFLLCCDNEAIFLNLSDTLSCKFEAIEDKKKSTECEYNSNILEPIDMAAAVGTLPVRYFNESEKAIDVAEAIERYAEPLKFKEFPININLTINGEGLSDKDLEKVGEKISKYFKGLNTQLGTNPFGVATQTHP